MAATITLTSDWHKNDYYVAAIHAAILSKHPEANIVSINNNIQTYSIVQAAFILRSVYKFFAPGTIHIIGIKSEDGKNTAHSVIKYHGQYFIGNDTGIFSLLFSEPPEEIILLQSEGNYSGSSFPELTIFARVASYILEGGNISELGIRVNSVKQSSGFVPIIDNNKIIGKVIYIDSYGNAITNISKTIWDEHINGHNFALYINNMRNKIAKIHYNYSDVGQGDLVAIFNTLGLLEIAQRESNISQMLKIDTNSEIFAEIIQQEDSLFT